MLIFEISVWWFVPHRVSCSPLDKFPSRVSSTMNLIRVELPDRVSSTSDLLFVQQQIPGGDSIASRRSNLLLFSTAEMFLQ